jgi:D-sedoheptulose 7-phosphate isomerase
MSANYLFHHGQSAGDFYKLYTKYLFDIMDKVNIRNFDTLINMLLEAQARGSNIYFAGNGGSAASANHFAQDLAEIGRKSKGKSFNSHSLVANSSKITAIGNDYGYDKIFSIQVEEFIKKEDVLIVISASGNSLNLINGVLEAKKKGVKTVGILGFDGGKLLSICDHSVLSPSPKGDYGPVEDAHLIFNHLIVQYLISYQLDQENKMIKVNSNQNESTLSI